MIQAAARRRALGDWRGACAAADVEVRLDLDAVRHRHGADTAGLLLRDLRTLAPDLLRWHLPRASHGVGRLLGELVVPLAGYPDRGGCTALTLAALTPGYALAAGERIVLTTLEGVRPDGAAAQRHSLRDRRMFWDSSRSGDLADLCATRRGAQQITGLQDAGLVAQAWAEAGIELVEGESPGVGRAERTRLVRRLAAVPVDLPGLAERVRQALPGLGSAAIRFGGGAVVLRGLDGSRAPSAEAVAAHVARRLPTIPDAVWMRPVDVDLLRFGLLQPSELHPLVAAALAPETGRASAAAAGPAGDRLYAAVPGLASITGSPDGGAAEVLVRCGAELHRVAQRDGRWQAVDHRDGGARESLIALLGGPRHSCGTATEYLSTGRHVVEVTDGLLAHGRVAEVVDLLCDHADAVATAADYELEDGRTLQDALEELREQTVRFRMILSGALRPERGPHPTQTNHWTLNHKRPRRRSRKGESARTHR